METESSFSILVFLKTFMMDGGIFMWVILVNWITGVGLSVYKAMSLKVYHMNGNRLFSQIKKYVLENNVEKAIDLCSKSSAILPQVLRAGLKRANMSKEKIEDALTTKISEQTPKITYKISYVQLIANLSTLLGLLGTIQGLILSFAGVANAEPGMKAKILSEGIAKAMNTTAFGLVSGITVMILHTILVNKAVHINDTVDEYANKLLDLLSSKKSE